MKEKKKKQKSAVLIYFAAEAWNHARTPKFYMYFRFVTQQQ